MPDLNTTMTMMSTTATTTKPHAQAPGAAFMSAISRLAAGGPQPAAAHHFQGRRADGESHYQGPERRHSMSLATRWLSAMLDEIDYGMLLLADGSQVLHVNHTARAELDAGHPLQLLGRELRARHSQDVARLHDALAAAQRGLRKLVTLGQGSGEQPLCVAVVPLGALGEPASSSMRPGSPPSAPRAEPSQATLLVMGKRKVCEGLSVQWFARIHALTPAESRVLEALCRGDKASQIASDNGVELSTVRTQIGAIRAKTGADGIQDLVRRVAVLPPILSSLRMAA